MSIQGTVGQGKAKTGDTVSGEKITPVRARPSRRGAPMVLEKLTVSMLRPATGQISRDTAISGTPWMWRERFSP